MNKEQKSAEAYSANEHEKQSIRDWYKEMSSIELHDDGINTIIAICPPEKYGEDENCEGLQNVIREMYYRITELEEENKRLREALTNISSSCDGNNPHHFTAWTLAEQALKEKI